MSIDDPFDDAYRRLVDYVGGADDPADPADVLAMQMVLRIEKTEPPDRAALLVAAARAVALLCLDDRSGGAGAWAAAMDAWCAARIRKIARRARGAQWAAAQDVPGVTVDIGDAPADPVDATDAAADPAGDAGANAPVDVRLDGGRVQARALVPGRVGDVDKRISRLQIGGTEVDGPLPVAPGRPSDGGQLPSPAVRLWINPDLDMTVGKLAAQVGHGAMLVVKLMDRESARRWRDAGCPLGVYAADPDRWARLVAAAGDHDHSAAGAVDPARGRAVAVRDAGFTEIAPGSVTVIADLADTAD
ncbi:peptidyl-tRNA hydrolase [Gordonia sinesedis]